MLGRGGGAKRATVYFYTKTLVIMTEVLIVVTFKICETFCVGGGGVNCWRRFNDDNYIMKLYISALGHARKFKFSIFMFIFCL